MHDMACGNTDKGNWDLSLASYPVLLTPAFVACSTNAGEGLIKLSHMQWCTWMCGRIAPLLHMTRYVITHETILPGLPPH